MKRKTGKENARYIFEGTMYIHKQYKLPYVAKADKPTGEEKMRKRRERYSVMILSNLVLKEQKDVVTVSD